MGSLHDLAGRLRQVADPAGGVADAELLRRFAATRDEAAFELLVWRHGAMVLNTCRRVLGRSADAEDAFQATFLALVRRAGSVRDGRTLAGWLHRVAHRAAVRAKAGAVRRARHERAGLVKPPGGAARHGPDDLAAVLDEEIERLPGKLRAAFVLCHLEGRTNEEAAARLGCPKGTILSRLSRARERLRVSLTRRGLAVPAAILSVTPLGLEAALVDTTVRAAVGFATGHAAGVVSAPVLTLTHGVLRTMFLHQLRPALAVLTLAAVAVGGVLAARERPTAPATPSAASVAAPAPAGPTPPRTLAIADQGFQSVAHAIFTPDGRRLAVFGEGNQTRLMTVWDAATGKALHTRGDGLGGDAAFSPDGKTLATACTNADSVVLCDTDTWKEQVKLEDHPGVTGVAFSPDGKLVATRSSFAGPPVLSQVRVWDAATGKARLTLAPKGDETLVGAAFSPAGLLAVCTNRGEVRLVDPATGAERAAVKLGGGHTLVTFTPKEVLVWSPALRPEERAIRLIDPATGKETRSFAVAQGLVRSVAVAPDGKRVMAVSDDNAVTIWDEGGKVLETFRPAADRGLTPFYAGFAPDNRTLIVFGYEAVKAENADELVPVPVTLLTTADGKELRRLPHVREAAFSPNGKAVALVSGGGGAPSPTGAAGPAVPEEVVVHDYDELLKAAPGR